MFIIQNSSAKIADNRGIPIFTLTGNAIGGGMLKNGNCVVLCKDGKVYLFSPNGGRLCKIADDGVSASASDKTIAVCHKSGTTRLYDERGIFKGVSY